jgi:hypothetical protein
VFLLFTPCYSVTVLFVTQSNTEKEMRHKTWEISVGSISDSPTRPLAFAHLHICTFAYLPISAFSPPPPTFHNISQISFNNLPNLSYI